MKTKALITLSSVLFLFSTIASPALAATGFSDLSETHANYTAIMDLQERGIIGGYPDGTYKPDQTVNRVEALKIILLGAGVDVETANGTAVFTDTNQNEWYAKYVNKAVSLKIVEGYPDGSFKPSNTINLVEALKIVQLANEIDLSDTDVSSDPFADAYAGQWYAPYLQYAKDKNLVDADALNKIYPDRGMTRGMLAEIIYRLIYVLEYDLEEFNEEEITEPVEEEEEEPAIFTWGIKAENNFFYPKEMTIGKDSTVRWTNMDDGAHTVTADGGEFDSGNLENGDTFEYTFNDLGTFTYHCELHPTMTGTIIVKPANEVPTI